MPHILVVDDEPLIREHLRLLLRQDGHEVETVPDGRSALEALLRRPFQLLITDWRMHDMDGMTLLAHVRDEGLPLGVILLTGHGDTQVALDAMKAGADDFVTKPYEPDALRFLVRRILERRELRDELENLRRRMREHYGFHNMVSKSARMRRVFDLIEQVAPHKTTVLIHGETGTGKELVAQAIHASSGRRGPLVAVNCAALSESLLESELFGHERGAFTGADHRKEGRFELADGGTLFLDEIAEISPDVQAKLLRVLQSGQFERLGGSATLSPDVRLVAASNKRLEDEVKARRFRSDLFYRLNVVRVDLPPLRERKEDVALLAMHFLDRNRAMSTPPVTEIEPEAMQALIEYGWPGNVRELENAIRAAIALADGPTIRRAALPPAIAPRPEGLVGPPILDTDRPLPEVTEDLISRVERDYLARLLVRYKGNVAQCARHSGLSRRSVAQKMAKYDLDRTQFKSAVADLDEE
jgi:DNA-binding NtrC family response regulator